MKLPVKVRIEGDEIDVVDAKGDVVAYVGIKEVRGTLSDAQLIVKALNDRP